MDLRTSATLFGLVVAAMATGAVYWRNNADEPEPAPRSQPGIGYYAKGVRLIETGDDGRIRVDVTAGTVTQTLADGSVTLNGVQMNYDPHAEVPWNLTAETGRVPQDGNIIELSGNVVATTRANGRPPATIRTDYLTYDPSTYIAATDRKVTVEYAGNIVHATGMRVTFTEDRFELISQVYGTYVR